MKRGKDIGKVEVGVANKVVGGYTTHTIGFWTPAPVYNGFLSKLISSCDCIFAPE